MKTIKMDGLIGGWFGITASYLRHLLPEDKSTPVKVVINSRGGDVFEGFAIYQMLSEYSNLTVELGALVGSAASYAILSAKKVIARSTSTVMIHKAWGVVRGNSDEMKKKGSLLSNIDSMIADAYAKKTGGLPEDMLSAMKDETWFVSGKTIKDFGLADEVVGEEILSDSQISEARNSIETAISNFRNEALRIEMGEAKPVAPMSNNLEDSDSKEEKLSGKTPDTQVQNQQTPPAPQNTPPAPVVDNTEVIKAAVDAERQRILALVKLGNVQVTEPVMNAINEGMDTGTYAVAQLEANNAAPKGNTTVINSIPTAPQPKDTVPESDTVNAAVEKDADMLVSLMS